jgi:hypothetical protein
MFENFWGIFLGGREILSDPEMSYLKINTGLLKKLT